MARLAFESGRLEEAIAHSDQVLAIRRELGDVRGTLEMLVLLANIALAAERLEVARAHLREAYTTAWSPELRMETAAALDAAAHWMSSTAALDAAARVSGFTDAYRAESRSQLKVTGPPDFVARRDSLAATLRSGGLEAERSAGALEALPNIHRLIVRALRDP
jgi:hypothetical protein